MTTATRAWGLRADLFALVRRFKDLQASASASGQHDAADQIDVAACELARVYESLPGVFTDAAGDAKDRQPDGSEGGDDAPAA